jgi:ABC-type glycerol-3-phosphate transport system substrate-binding protein
MLSQSATPHTVIKLTGTLQPAATKTSHPTAQASATVSPAAIPTAVDLPAAGLDGQEISFWYPWTGDTAEVVEQLVAEFNQINSWGIQVHSERHAGGQVLFQDVIDQLGTGAFPDVTAAPQEQARAWQDAGIKLLPLDRYIHDRQWGFTQAAINDYAAAIWNMGQSTGGIQLGIPALQTAHVLFYNATWAKELGFAQPPATVDAFIEQACRAAWHNRDDGIKGNDGTGGWLVNGDAYSVISWIQAFGGRLMTGADQSLRISSSETLEALLFVKNLERQGCAWIGKEDQPQADIAQVYFSERYALMISGDLADIPALERRLAAGSPADQWQVLPYPLKDPAAGAGPQVLVSGTEYYLIESDPARQLAGWVFIKWLAENPQAVRLVRASLSLPARSSMLADLKDWAAYEPQWLQAAGWVSSAKVPPASSQWAIALPLLEDGAQQAISPDTPSDQIPTILDRIDLMLSEMVKDD